MTMNLILMTVAMAFLSPNRAFAKELNTPRAQGLGSYKALATTKSETSSSAKKEVSFQDLKFKDPSGLKNASGGAGIDGGGGDVVMKDGRLQLLDLAESGGIPEGMFFPQEDYPTSYYNALKGSEYICWNSLLHLGTSHVLGFLPEVNDTVFQPLIWIMTSSPLEDISDEGAIRLTDVSTKRQVALQKNGYVIINKEIFESLGTDDRGALLYHEALLRVVLLSNPDLIKKQGTAPIRQFTKLVMNRDASKLPKTFFSPYCGMERNPESRGMLDAGLVYSKKQLIVRRLRP